MKKILIISVILFSIIKLQAQPKVRIEQAGSYTGQLYYAVPLDSIIEFNTYPELYKIKFDNITSYSENQHTDAYQLAYAFSKSNTNEWINKISDKDGINTLTDSTIKARTKFLNKNKPLFMFDEVKFSISGVNHHMILLKDGDTWFPFICKQNEAKKWVACTDSVLKSFSHILFFEPNNIKGFLNASALSNSAIRGKYHISSGFIFDKDYISEIRHSSKEFDYVPILNFKKLSKYDKYVEIIKNINRHFYIYIPEKESYIDLYVYNPNSIIYSNNYKINYKGTSEEALSSWILNRTQENIKTHSNGLFKYDRLFVNKDYCSDINSISFQHKFKVNHLGEVYEFIFFDDRCNAKDTTGFYNWGLTCAIMRFDNNSKEWKVELGPDLYIRDLELIFGKFTYDFWKKYVSNQYNNESNLGFTYQSIEIADYQQKITKQWYVRDLFKYFKHFSIFKPDDFDEKYLQISPISLYAEFGNVQLTKFQR